PAYRRSVPDLENVLVLERLRGPLFDLAVVVIGFVALAALPLYVMARWRTHRDPIADPQLGLKFALHYFATLAFHVALIGTSTPLGTVISPGSDGKGVFSRFGFGLVIPAALVLGAHVAILRRTTDVALPTVRRLVGGYNLVITGLLGFAALIGGFEA